MVQHIERRVLVILLGTLLPAAGFFLKDINLGLDLRGGSILIYKVPSAGRDSLEETRRVMQTRADTLGVAAINFSIDTTQSEIHVELPGLSQEEAARVKRVLTQLGKLEWRPVTEQGDWALAGTTEEAARKTIFDKPGEEQRVHFFPEPREKAVIAWMPPYKAAQERDRDRERQGFFVKMDEQDCIKGSDLAHVRMSQDNYGMPAPSFELLPASRAKMARVTEKFRGKNMAILFNDRALSAPRIESRIETHGIITGINDPDEIRELITVMKSGSLEVQPVLLSEENVGPSLGEDSISKGVWATGIGTALIIVFMLVYYRLAGMVANIGLVMNIVILLGLMTWLGATLTLPGIAGIALTLGMAVDANMLVHERVREEWEKGKPVAQAYAAGYDRATVTVLDSHLTTLFSGIILYLVGTGPVKGFAVTLCVGLVITLFTALYVTRTLFAMLLNTGTLKRVSFMNPFNIKNVPFLSAGRYAIAISLLLVFGGLLAFGMRGKENLGIDFQGGSKVRIRFAKPIEIDLVRNELATLQQAKPDYKELDVLTIKPSGVENVNPGESNLFEVNCQVREDMAEAFVADVKSWFARKGLLVPDTFETPKYPGGRIPKDATDPADKEFAGGFNIHVNLVAPAEPGRIEQILGDARIGKVKVEPATEAGAGRGVSTYVVRCQGEGDATYDMVATRTRQTLEKAREIQLSDPMPLSRFVGSKVAGDMVQKAIMAVVLSLIVQAIYIRIRFAGFDYGLAAAIALIHDVAITLGAIALMDWPGS
jgi:SecD/SecF fusion protein